MWIFAQHGFLSIVEDRFDPNMLLIRGRVAGDIEAYFPDSDTIETPDGDYRYRARISRQEAAAAVAKAILGIGYGNYKSSISERRRGPFYMRVWATMAEMQETLI